MRLWIVAVLLLSSVVGSVHAQPTLPTIYIEPIAGGDDYSAERYRLLFLEALTKLKSVTVVRKKEQAQYIVGGIGRVEMFGAASAAEVQTPSLGVGRNQAGVGWSATLSVTLTEQATDRLAFVSNHSTSGGLSKGATQTAVDDAVKAMKKAMHWK